MPTNKELNKTVEELKAEVAGLKAGETSSDGSVSVADLTAAVMSLAEKVNAMEEKVGQDIAQIQMYLGFDVTRACRCDICMGSTEAAFAVDREVAYEKSFGRPHRDAAKPLSEVIDNAPRMKKVV